MLNPIRWMPTMHRTSTNYLDSAAYAYAFMVHILHEVITQPVLRKYKMI